VNHSALSLPDDIRRVEWLPPWKATDEALDVELRREVGRGHPLEGRRAVAIARRMDQDGVLFWLPDRPGLVASVHLTWRGVRERDPRFPWTRIYDSVADWIEQEMRVDHADYRRGDFGPEEAKDRS